ncbi:MAG: DoxX family protein [Chloroflexota bacterium]|nr:DoxX family protein [Chloroflexota bacterium]
MHTLFDRFDRLDTRMNRWLVTHSITLLRISLGLIFLAFGVLKFFPGVSPIEDLATRTTDVLSFAMLPPSVGMTIIAILECAIGLCFITGRLLRIAVWLMGAQMLGAMSPLVLFPGELFSGPSHAPTLAAQYIIKDVVLVGAGLVIAATWNGAQIVAEPRSMRSTLRAAAPRVIRRPHGELQPTGQR